MEKKLCIHVPIPFATKKCSCDPEYYIVDADMQVRSDYLDALSREMMLTAPECDDYTVTTILFDGGPVQSFPPAALPVFVNRILKNYRCAKDPAVILTADPFEIDHVKAANYSACGVTLADVRLFSSIRAECEAVNRPFPHRTFAHAAQALRSFNLKDFGAQVFCNLPGQTAGSLGETLSECIGEGAKHISLDYLEPYNKAQYQYAVDVLKKNGYAEYAPGKFGAGGFAFDCYPLGETDVLGLGLNAMTVMDGVRSVTTGDLKTYLAHSGDVTQTAVEVAAVL